MFISLCFIPRAHTPTSPPPQVALFPFHICICIFEYVWVCVSECVCAWPLRRLHGFAGQGTRGKALMALRYMVFRAIPRLRFIIIIIFFFSRQPYPAGWDRKKSCFVFCVRSDALPTARLVPRKYNTRLIYLCIRVYTFIIRNHVGVVTEFLLVSSRNYLRRVFNEFIYCSLHH